METSSSFYSRDKSTTSMGESQALIDPQDKSRFHSLIAIGAPIVDIIAKVDKESIKKYKLKWGDVVTVDQKNIEFFSELESMFQVTYIPGGAIQNTLRVCSWCLNMEPSNQNKYSITMLGATGDDTNRKKILKALENEKIKPLLQAIPT